MNSSPHAQQFWSRVRWYFGLVGILGMVATGATLDSSGLSRLEMLHFAAGIPVLVGYLAAAVVFHRLRSGPWLRRLAVGMAVWSASLALRSVIAIGPGAAIPMVLFVLLPAINTVWRLQDLQRTP